ncbi:GH17964 [Drosophila grimshawi]|uniref:GH17964 n=2 Tax=Drosophila grimshawi TaxID=7222 RepID=B4JSK3_DROGR|nr:GH17964 [Drosophila grimshawi]
MQEEELTSQPAAYSMRPAFGESFPLPIVKNIINSVMTDKLKDKTYDKDVAKNWTREIADDVNQQIASNPKVKRYKHVVQVMLGQELGAGSTYLSRCCWDCDCDTSVTEVFSNTSLFCVCTVFGTYQY